MIRLALFSLALLQGAAEAADVPGEPARTGSPDTVHVHNYGDRDAACLRWTDNCRMCSRDADGKAICSNIGIQCQPAEVKCISHKDEGEKK
jgi:hypothetical protein